MRQRAPSRSIWLTDSYYVQIVSQSSSMVYETKKGFCVRYHDSPASFTSLAAQTAALSRSAPALYASAGAGARGITFRESEGGETDIDMMRRRAGMRPWAGTGDGIGS